MRVLAAWLLKVIRCQSQHSRVLQTTAFNYWSGRLAVAVAVAADCTAPVYLCVTSGVEAEGDKRILA